MIKKEKFVRLVEVESKMRADGDRRYRGYVTSNVYYAMYVKESCIPEDTGYEELLKSVNEFIDYQNEGGEKPKWLELERK